MKGNSLIYNNSLINKMKFIDSILINNSQSEIPTCEIKETPDFYNINIDSFHGDKHVLEISYKNYFLILKMILKNNKKFLFERIFYLTDINSNNILLSDYKNQIKLIIPKVKSY